MADRFREHRRDVINGKNDLPVPTHFNQPNHTLEDMKVAVLKAGLVNQEYRKKQEMRFILGKELRLQLHGNSLFSPLACRRALSRARACNWHASYFNELFNGFLL